MASLLYQTIEQISREKHIEPEIIVAAIEDAMVVAARKYYRTEEDIRSKFNPESGQVDVFSVHTVVEEVTDPLREISLGDAKKRQPEIEAVSYTHLDVYKRQRQESMEFLCLPLPCRFAALVLRRRASD